MPYIFRDPTNRKRRLISHAPESNWVSLLNYWAETTPFPGYEPEPYPGVTPGGSDYVADYRALLKEAEKYLGYSYLWGGKTPPYFDCSGYVAWCYKTAGMIPQDTIAFTGTLILACNKVPLEWTRAGDMVFWGGTETGTANDANAHVGIYIGNNMILDDSGSGVAYRNLDFHPTSRFLGFYRPLKYGTPWEVN